MFVQRTKALRWLLPAIFGLTLVSNISAVTHIIYFGDNFKPEYRPSQISVNVGDTVSWRGDFHENPLSSLSVPAGAAGFSSFSGGQFDYVVKTAGTFRYQSNMPHSLAMIGSFVATSAAEAGRAAMKK
jgi:plastocyanin